VYVNSLLISAIALAALTTVAAAGEPLSNQQMDRVTAAGFPFHFGSSAVAIANAAAIGGNVFTSTSTFALAGHDVSIALSSSVSVASSKSH
jgi:hypothetical protein